ncbi:hypothetical protein [Halopseudomonas pelagia]
MDMEGLDPQKLIGCPPLMPWQKFAEWIGMGDEPIVVRTWIDRGYLPSLKVGKRVMVNVALCSGQMIPESFGTSFLQATHRPGVSRATSYFR